MKQRQRLKKPMQLEKVIRKFINEPKQSNAPTTNKH